MISKNLRHPLLQRAQGLSFSSQAPVDISEAFGKETRVKVSYNRRDLIIYALGIGCQVCKSFFQSKGSFHVTYL